MKKYPSVKIIPVINKDKRAWELPQQEKTFKKPIYLIK